MTAPRQAERKHATVMFADLVGFTGLSERLGAERAYLITTECLKRLDAVTRKHGGAVDRYLGDCLMAVFGYPIPLDDDAAAGVEAALEMRELVASYTRQLGLEVPLELKVGLNTGSLVAGDIRAGGAIREFHVLGDTVNVAARLKAKAPPGGIFVGGGTQQASVEHYAYGDLGALQLKGKTERVATFELRGRRGQRVEVEDAVATDFVGRERELAVLRQALDSGRSAAFALTGEDGSGKSRLLAELRAAISGVGWLAVPVEEVASLDLDGLRSHGPLLLAVDEIERTDARSLNAILALLAATADSEVLVVLAGRPGSAVDSLLAHERVERIALGPLSGDACRALLDRLLSDSVRPETRARVEARAAGNPRRLILGAFLAPALEQEAERERTSGERASDTERRRATVLFADLTGFTALTASLGDAEAYAIVAECLGILDDVTRRHGGHVDKYLGDCVMALFGVPVAIEDAPRAAVNAAIEMRARIQQFSRELELEFSIDVHSGINTGLAIAGDVSGPLLREFALMGEPVVVADLLTHEADAGHVQVGEETWRLVRDAFEFERAGEVQVPGRSEPVGAYELRSDRVQLHRRSAEALFGRFVGRESELEKLRETVALLTSGRGGIVSLVAETGLGKSRLLSEVRDSAEARDIHWLEARSISVGQRLGFHPFADLLRGWAGIDDDETDKGAHAKLRRALVDVFGDESPAVYPFLGSLLGLRLSEDDQATLSAVPGESLASLMQANLTELLRRLAEASPLAIVFEDLQWADQSSVEQIESLLRLVESAQLLMVNVFRPGFADTSQRIDAYAREHHGGYYVRLELKPLSDVASRGLFERIEVPIEVRLAIVERSAGNPLYVEEVVRSLVEEGAVEFHDGSFRATRSIDEAAIPANVGDVVMARVDRLGEAERQLLRAASVIGGRFPRSVIERVFDGSGSLGSTLEALERGEFIRTRGEELAFRHPLVREVIYDGLLETVREELHRKVAAAIEVVSDPEQPGYYAMLAWHYGRGRDTENAEQALFRAGDEAARSAASNEALQFFREASQLYAEMHGDDGDPAKEAQLEKNVALALANRGRSEESWPHFDRALARMGERVLTSPLALRLRFVRDALSVLARLYLRPRRRPASEREQEIVALMFRRGLMQATGQTTRFLFDSTSLLRRVSRLDPATVPNGAELYAGAVAIFSVGGVSFALGKRFLDQAFEMCERRGEPPDTFLLVMNFIHHFLAGDWSEAHEIEDARVEVAIRGGRHFEILQYLFFVIEKRVCQGRFEGVAPLVERIEQLWDVYQYATARFAPRGVEMLVEHQRRTAGAVAAADAYYRETDQDSLHLHALGCRADVQILRGDRDAAAGTLAEGDQILARAGRPGFYQRSAYASALFLHELVRLEEGGAGRRDRALAAKKRAKLAASCAARVAFRQPEVLRLRGRLAWLRGKEREALGLWRRSLETAERLGMAPERARTCAELALRLRNSGRSSALQGRNPKDWRDEARRLMRSLSLDLDLDRLERGLSP